MEVKCAYCGKKIEQGKEVKGEVVYRSKGTLARKTSDYCSQQCSSHAQMAHEG